MEKQLLQRWKAGSSPERRCRVAAERTVTFGASRRSVERRRTAAVPGPPTPRHEARDIPIHRKPGVSPVEVPRGDVPDGVRFTGNVVCNSGARSVRARQSRTWRRTGDRRPFREEPILRSVETDPPFVETRFTGNPVSLGRHVNSAVHYSTRRSVVRPGGRTAVESSRVDGCTLTVHPRSHAPLSLSPEARCVTVVRPSVDLSNPSVR